MEKKKMRMAVKTEDDFRGAAYPLSSVFDFWDTEKSSLGFMELLGVQDYGGGGGCSLLDWPQLSTVPTTATGKECSEVLSQQQPATPNSSSISSASSEAVYDELNKTVDQAVEENEDEEEDHHDDAQHKTKKLLKTKKTNQKGQKEPRFAFMTKSEVDHLEDGYRWRKYGQKAVKNSPFPRSYYRCTSASCNVKKRVERSFTDPSVVVTTYEGQHTHPSPVMPRSGFVGPTGSGNYLSHQQQEQLLVNTLSSLGCFPNYNNETTSSASASASASRNNAAFPQERVLLCNPGATHAFLRDHGLLQDVVPSHMLKEE